MPSPYSSFFTAFRLFFLLIISLFGSLYAATGEGWAFVKIAQNGEGGFTSITQSVASADGKVAILGTKDGVNGIYLVSGGTVTPVVTRSATLNATLGKVESIGDQFHIDVQGRVVFTASLSGGTLPEGIYQRCLRWSAGSYSLMLPDDSNSSHLAKQVAADGRWVVERLISNSSGRTWEHSLTDGTTQTLLGTYSVGTVSSVADAQFGATPCGIGKIALLRQKRTETKDEFGSVASVKLVTEIIRYGNGTETLVQATTNSAPSAESSVLLATGDQIIDFVASSSGDAIAYLRTTVTGGKSGNREVTVLSSSSSRVTSFSTDEKSMLAEAVDGQGRTILTYLDASTSALQTGANPASDRIVGVGDSLFGNTLTSVSFSHAAEAPGVFGDRRSLTFLYRFGSRPSTEGVALATRNVARWTPASGGAWATATAWSTQAVPESTTEVLFDLENTYDVEVGTASVGRASVENGSVAWRRPALNVTAGIAIGADGSLTQSEGEISAGEVVIGSLPPLNVADTSVARLRFSNKGTVFRTSGEATVGKAGKGDLAISGATVTNATVRIGAGSEGSASVGSQDTLWTTGALSVGDTSRGTLAIENGAHVLSTQVVIGRGDTPSTQVAEVTVDNGNGDLPAAGPGNWFISGDLTVGGNIGGRLNIRKGGSVGVGGLFKAGTVPGVGDLETIVSLNGAGTKKDKPSYLYVLGNAELGTATQSFTHLEALDGAIISLGQKVSVATAAGSLAQILVGGVNENGDRAIFGTQDETMLLGDRGEGIFFVTDGGLALVTNLLVGGQTGSKGELVVSGINKYFGSTLRSFLLVVGGDSSAGTSNSAPGTLTVQDFGSVEVSGTFALSRLGRFQGDGVVVAASSLIEGTIAPGAVFVESPNFHFGKSLVLAGAASSPADRSSAVKAVGRAGTTQAAVLPPGTLTLRGNVEFKPTARVELTVGSAAPGGFDRLKVEGDLKLGGTLALYFVDGYAPAKGETFDLVTSTTQSGAFAGLEATGVAAGFEYSAAGLGDGRIRITALNDAIPATAPRINTSPQAKAGALGKQVLFTVTATGSGLSYQWRKNGVAITGATGATLVLNSLTTEQAGAYDVLVTNAGGSVTSDSAALTVSSVTAGQIYNLSVRTGLASGQNLIVGFVVSGGNKSFLLRGVGPGLEAFLSGIHPDPTIALFDNAGTLLASNDNWDAALTQTMSSVGAFALPDSSKDAALVSPISGLRTAHVNGPGSGVVLVELYDTEDVGAARLVNVSARNQVGEGEGILIAGFAIRGDGPLQVLIRGIGPTLAAFGVTHSLGDPILTLYDVKGLALATNDDWPGSLSSTFTRVGAFALPSGSADAALSVALEPGVYTVHLQGKAGTTGEGLVEVYEIGAP